MEITVNDVFDDAVFAHFSFLLETTPSFYIYTNQRINVRNDFSCFKIIDLNRKVNIKHSIQISAPVFILLGFQTANFSLWLISLFLDQPAGGVSATGIIKCLFIPFVS